MKYSFLFLFSVLSFVSSASDTLRVTTHNGMTIVTDPSKGFNLYKSWGVFPAANVPVRKITLHVKFGCPDSLRCADWDYKDHITLRRKGGVNSQSQDFELARMLTPYGGAFAKDWNFSWELDVTDFSLLLRDSVEIEYNHTGYEPANDRGWKVTLEFEIIKGTPAWEPISIQKIYDSSYRYGDSTNNIENALKPVTFTAAPGADFARLRMVQTGHGMDRPDGCGEFCNKYRQVFFDGKLIDTRPIWKECGDNPLYPQAGTWIYDRAAWCPGDLMQPDVFNLKLSPNKQHTIDINMQPYVASTKPSADEVISAYLIQYKKAAAKNDVQLVDIIRPSNKDVYKRQNPTALPPQLIVKNMGSSAVNRMGVHYGNSGPAKKTFLWKGELPPFGVDTITMPETVADKKGLNMFEAELLLPNGQRDAFPSDNKRSNYYEATPRHDSMLIVYLQTNNQPAQTGYTLVSSGGDVIKQRPFQSLLANTVYRDTIMLRRGHYQFTLQDSADNGLEFWANPRGGRGKARLLDGKGQMLKDFESDFGSYVHYDFTVGESADPVTDQRSMGLYPTRTNDKTTFDYYSNFPQDVVVRLVTDPGDQVVEEHRYLQLKEGIFTYDLSRFPKGRFYLVVLIDGKEQFKKRIRLKE
jgi:hypothetical protein